MSEKLASLALFENLLNLLTKRRMIIALQKEANSERQAQNYSKRVSVAIDSWINKKMGKFNTATLMIFFQLLKLPVEYVDDDPEF